MRRGCLTNASETAPKNLQFFKATSQNSAETWQKQHSETEVLLPLV